MTATTEPGITISVALLRATAGAQTQRIVLLVDSEAPGAPLPTWLQPALTPKDTVFRCQPRGTAETRWTSKNPPNFVARAHYLLGRTILSGRVWDVASIAAGLATRHRGIPIWVAGENEFAVSALYAAVLEPRIAGLFLDKVPASHMEKNAPPLLNVLRVCDIPDALGMVAPRPITLSGVEASKFDRSAAIYRSAGAANKLVFSR